MLYVVYFYAETMKEVREWILVSDKIQSNVASIKGVSPDWHCYSQDEKFTDVFKSQPGMTTADQCSVSLHVTKLQQLE